MLPKALKSCPKSNKSPNLVTLLPAHFFMITLRSTTFTFTWHVMKIMKVYRPHCVKTFDFVGQVFSLLQRRSEFESSLGLSFFCDALLEKNKNCPMVVAQLTERLLPTPEGQGSKPVMVRLVIFY